MVKETLHLLCTLSSCLDSLNVLLLLSSPVPPIRQSTSHHPPFCFLWIQPNYASPPLLKRTQTLQQDRWKRTNPPITPFWNTTTVGNLRHLSFSLFFSPDSFSHPFNGSLSLWSHSISMYTSFSTPEPGQDVASCEEMSDICPLPPSLPNMLACSNTHEAQVHIVYMHWISEHQLMPHPAPQGFPNGPRIIT